MRFFKYVSTMLIATTFWACNDSPNSEQKPAMDAASQYTKDYHSFSNPAEAVVKHLSLKLEVDFTNRILSGSAKYAINSNNATKIILDTRDLEIKRITLGFEEIPASYVLRKARGYFGRALEIRIQPTTDTLTIYYHTSPNAAAILWLDKEQTADKKAPFLFTQGQAILTRSWIPIQDSPGVRLTYDAQIQTPKGMLALMSAENPQKTNETGRYNFNMPQPIPPYLIALAIGNMEFKSLSNKTGVYAESSMLSKASYEFGDLDKMLSAAENLYGPYLWDRYDLLVLPPSFPFGGMENPRLTFATPTILAGDRSLTSLIAHELAHSWSGNLVTNATWNDFWLNEGFTVYFERRIMEAVYGEEYAAMLEVLGHQDLINEIERLGPTSKDTHLQLSLKGRNPDHGMTDIAYEKGYFFLRTLEEKVGREKFDKFLQDYFATHQFQTITTDQFRAYLRKNLIEPYSLDFDMEEWISKPGLPKNHPPVHSVRFNEVDRAIVAFNESGKITKADKDWSSHEWLHFIRNLPKSSSLDQIKYLEKTLQFSQSNNSEIKAAWLIRGIESGIGKQLLPQINDFLIEVGRRKFLTPIYTALVKHGFTQNAKDIYTKAQNNYHSIATGTIEEIFAKAEKNQ